jgi:hypothetical protein
MRQLQPGQRMRVLEVTGEFVSFGNGLEADERAPLAM